MSAHTFLPDMSLATWEIPDPGNGGALPVSQCGIVSLVSAAAETRTLADPVRSGLLLGLAFKTDGGDCVVTAASDVTMSSGDDVMTFADAGDFVLLMSIAVGTGFKWRQIVNHGAALT